MIVIAHELYDITIVNTILTRIELVNGLYLANYFILIFSWHHIICNRYKTTLCPTLTRYCDIMYGVVTFKFYIPNVIILFTTVIDHTINNHCLVNQLVRIFGISSNHLSNNSDYKTNS